MKIALLNPMKYPLNLSELKTSGNVEVFLMKIHRRSLHNKYFKIGAFIDCLNMLDPEISKEWFIVAEKRLQAYKEGRLETISFEDMFGERS
jgi:hypothetical protein